MKGGMTSAANHADDRHTDTPLVKRINILLHLSSYTCVLHMCHVSVIVVRETPLTHKVPPGAACQLQPDSDRQKERGQ